MPKSCYIHIPFCEKICSYCDFCKMFYQKKWVDEYLVALEKEIDELYQGEEMETIYIGGGTPSVLSYKELEKLFQIVKKIKRTDYCEFTIEGNFESTTKDKLELYFKNGINRLSFGIESVNPKNCEFLERENSKEKIEEVLKIAREIGFQNINVDLIYALPIEDMEVLKEDMNYLFSLNAEHISTYSLIIEDHTKLRVQGVEPISDELDLKMYEEICKEMKDHGYHHYEISNFAKPGFESKHNLVYWKNEEYYGFGLGASSYKNHERIENTRSPGKYKEGKRILHKEVLTKQDEIEYEVLLNFRKQDGIDLEKFQEKYQCSFDEVFDTSFLEKNHFLEREENHLFIPENKWYISNEIIVKSLEGEKNE